MAKLVVNEMDIKCCWKVAEQEGLFLNTNANVLPFKIKCKFSANYFFPEVFLSKF